MWVVDFGLGCSAWSSSVLGVLLVRRGSVWCPSALLSVSCLSALLSSSSPSAPLSVSCAAALLSACVGGEQAYCAPTAWAAQVSRRLAGTGFAHITWMMVAVESEVTPPSASPVLLFPPLSPPFLGWVPGRGEIIGRTLGVPATATKPCNIAWAPPISGGFGAFVRVLLQFAWRHLTMGDATAPHWLHPSLRHPIP